MDFILREIANNTLDTGFNDQLLEAADYINSLEQRLAAAESRTCELQEDSDTYNNLWNGECGAVWEFIADGPLENNCNFCPECGGKLVIAECSQQEESGKGE